MNFQNARTSDDELPTVLCKSKRKKPQHFLVGLRFHHGYTKLEAFGIVPVHLVISLWLPLVKVSFRFSKFGLKIDDRKTNAPKNPTETLAAQAVVMVINRILIYLLLERFSIKCRKEFLRLLWFAYYYAL